MSNEEQEMIFAIIFCVAIFMWTFMALAIYGLDRMSRGKHGDIPPYDIGICLLIWWGFLITGFFMGLMSLFSGYKIVRVEGESQENKPGDFSSELDKALSQEK